MPRAGGQRGHVVNLQSQIETAKKNAEEAIAKLDAANKETAEARAELEAAKKDTDNVRAELRNETEGARAARKEAEEARSKLEAANEDTNNARAELQAEKTKNDRLSNEANLLHNDAAEFQQKFVEEQEKVKNLETEANREKKISTDAAEEAKQAAGRERDAAEETKKLQTLLQQEKARVTALDELVKNYESELKEKAEKLRKERDAAGELEGRLRTAEEELKQKLEEKKEELAIAENEHVTLELIKEKLAATFEQMNRDLTPEAILNYIDDTIEESRLPKAPSNVSLNAEWQTGARAKGGARKVSMGDELDKAEESVDDDGYQDDTGYIEDLEGFNRTLREDNANLQSKVEALQANMEKLQANTKTLQANLKKQQSENAKLQAERKDSKQLDTPPTLTPTTEASEIVADQANAGQTKKTTTGAESTDNGQKVKTITKIVEKPVERLVTDPTRYPTSFFDIFVNAPWHLKLVWLLMLIGFVYNFYLTWTERRMWLDANEKPWLYHDYMARQAESIFPLFSFNPEGPWIDWIEYEVLGYLRVLPG